MAAAALASCIVKHKIIVRLRSRSTGGRIELKNETVWLNIFSVSVAEVTESMVWACALTCNGTSLKMQRTFKKQQAQKTEWKD